MEFIQKGLLLSIKNGIQVPLFDTEYRFLQIIMSTEHPKHGMNASQ